MNRSRARWTEEATGQTIGQFITGNTLTLASPSAVTFGSAAITPDDGVSSYNVNWDGLLTLALTLSGNRVVEITQADCSFDVRGDGVDVPVP